MAGFDTSDRYPPEAEEETLLIKPNDSIIPVTVKQLQRSLQEWSSDRDVLINGQPRKQVALVGLICSVIPESLGTVYEIDDSTGLIRALDLTRDSDTPELPKGTYCHVVGRLTPREESAQISAFSVRAVRDFNQIPYHMLQALYVYLHMTRGLPNASAFLGMAPSPVRRAAEVEQPQTMAVGATRKDLACQAVMKLLNRGNKTDGTPRREIIAGLSKDFSVEEIDEAIETLRYNSDIYPGQNDRFCPIS
jgi:hypothetical protein